MEFTLMNKDMEIVTFNTYRTDFDAVRAENIRVLRADLLPPEYKKNILKFIENRKAPRHRKYICSLLKQLGAEDVEGFIKVSNAASLTDTFWVRDEENPKTWDDVSLYRNNFDEKIARIAFEGGIGTHGATTPELTVDGNYPKCWIRDNDQLYLLKRGSETYGREVFAEYYASQVSNAICNDTVKYDLVNYHGHLATKCEIFTSEKTGFSQMINYVENPHSVSTREALSVIENFDDGNNFRRMTILDALTLNIDRHLGNFGLLVDNDSMKPVGMAPAFDNNRAMLFNYNDERFESANMDKLIDIYPRLMGEFNLNANDMLTPEIKSDLKNFSGFRFERHQNFNWPEERLTKFEVFMEKQVDKILHRTKLFVS